MSYLINTKNSTSKKLESFSIRPFFRWAGGKQNLIKKIFEFTPERKLNKYFEPFLGAGSMFFHGQFDNAFLSDINPNLVNAFRYVRDNPIELFNSIQELNESLSKEFYYKVRDDYNNDLTKQTVEQAARFIFLVHTSFNGIYRVNKKGHYNVPFGKKNPALPSLNHLKTASLKLSNSQIHAQYYDEILNLVDQDSFVYLDPPYPPLSKTANFQHYTVDKFSHKQQIDVAEFAYKLAEKNAAILISNADTQEINSLYKDWNIKKLQTTRYISCKSKRTKVHELVITNY